MSAKSKIVVLQHWILFSKKVFFSAKTILLRLVGVRVSDYGGNRSLPDFGTSDSTKKRHFSVFRDFFRAELVKTKLPEYSDDFYSGKRFRFSGVSPASRDQSFHEFDCFALKKVPNRLFRSRCISFLPALITGFARHESSRRKLFLSGAD